MAKLLLKPLDLVVDHLLSEDVDPVLGRLVEPEQLCPAFLHSEQCDRHLYDEGVVDDWLVVVEDDTAVINVKVFRGSSRRAGDIRCDRAWRARPCVADSRAVDVARPSSAPIGEPRGSLRSGDPESSAADGGQSPGLPDTARDTPAYSEELAARVGMLQGRPKVTHIAG